MGRRIGKREATIVERFDKLEEQLAHLQRLTEDLSDIVARQETEIERLTRRVGMLMQREAEHAADAGGTIPLADQKPPHW